MSNGKKRGINKTFLRQLFKSFLFDEFRVTDAAKVYSQTRNKPEYALNDAHSELYRYWRAGILIHEKGGKYQMNPESFIVLKLVSLTF